MFLFNRMPDVVSDRMCAAGSPYADRRGKGANG